MESQDDRWHFGLNGLNVTWQYKQVSLVASVCEEEV